MDDRFWIGNITPEEMVKKRAEFLHSHGYKRGYYYAAEKEMDECIGQAQNGFWLLDIKKVAQVTWPETPENIAHNITRMVLEEVSHALGNVGHKTPQEEIKWRNLFIDVADGFSDRTG